MVRVLNSQRHAGCGSPCQVNDLEWTWACFLDLVVGAPAWEGAAAGRLASTVACLTAGVLTSAQGSGQHALPHPPTSSLSNLHLHAPHSSGAFFAAELYMGFHASFVANSGERKSEVWGARAVARYYVRRGSFWQDLVSTAIWVTQVGGAGCEVEKMRLSACMCSTVTARKLQLRIGAGGRARWAASVHYARGLKPAAPATAPTRLPSSCLLQIVLLALTQSGTTIPRTVNAFQFVRVIRMVRFFRYGVWTGACCRAGEQCALWEEL